MNYDQQMAHKKNVVEKCYADALNLEMDAKPGVGFVCLEDVLIP